MHLPLLILSFLLTGFSSAQTVFAPVAVSGLDTSCLKTALPYSSTRLEHQPDYLLLPSINALLRFYGKDTLASASLRGPLLLAAAADSLKKRSLGLFRVINPQAKFLHALLGFGHPLLCRVLLRKNFTVEIKKDITDQYRFSPEHFSVSIGAAGTAMDDFLKQARKRDDDPEKIQLYFADGVHSVYHSLQPVDDVWAQQAGFQREGQERTERKINAVYLLLPDTLGLPRVLGNLEDKYYGNLDRRYVFPEIRSCATAHGKPSCW